VPWSVARRPCAVDPKQQLSSRFLLVISSVVLPSLALVSCPSRCQDRCIRRSSAANPESRPRGTAVGGRTVGTDEGSDQPSGL
jgi:hypothetical protein